MKITFDIDASVQETGVDNYFPVIELLYDAPTGTVTLSLVHIRNEGHVLYTALQKFEGASGLTPLEQKEHPSRFYLRIEKALP